jgi:hypothetical protein
MRYPNRRSVAALVTLTAVAIITACEADKSSSGASAASDVAATSPTSNERAQIQSAKGAFAPSAPPAPSAGVVGSAFATGASESQGGQSFTLPSQESLAGAMLIRTGQASVQVDSLDAGINRIRVMAQRTGAIIANTSVQGGKDQVRTASLELRIPSNRFDEAIAGLAPIGTLESVNVSVQDVGEEFVDIQARVKNAERLEQRLIDLLANRTGKLSDVMTVERELARVREEIERYQGRLRYLSSRASVSTLAVNVHEPLPLVAERPGTHPIRDAFVQAWRNIVTVTAAIIASLGVLIPIGVVVAVLILLGRRIAGPRFGAPKPAETN